MESPDSLIVISDPHAKWTEFISIMQAQGIVDENMDWSFRNHQLMMIGDIFDRGDDATTIFWLMYKIQQQARDAGGEVSFLYGNHEEMVLRNSMGYTNAKYTNLSSSYYSSSTVYGSRFFNANTELGRWLGECNTIQIIGRDLYVHAGLSQVFYDRNYQIPALNATMSADILKTSGRDSYLFGSSATTGGPLWYRGMIPGRETPLTAAYLDSLLNRYEVNRIIIGHTEHNEGDGPIAYNNESSCGYDFQVVNVNVLTSSALTAGRGRGILIEKGKDTWIIYDKKANKAMSLPTAPNFPYPPIFTGIDTVPVVSGLAKVWVSDNTLNVKGENLKDIVVYSISGQVVQKGYGSSSFSVNTPGVYLVQVVTDQGTETIKAVIN
jgi:hypothetical protein